MYQALSSVVSPHSIVQNKCKILQCEDYYSDGDHLHGTVQVLSENRPIKHLRIKTTHRSIIHVLRRNRQNGREREY